MPAELLLLESLSRIMARTQDQLLLPHVLLPPRPMPRLSLPLQTPPPRLPSMPSLIPPSSITTWELIQSVPLLLKPTLTPSSQVPQNQLPVKLLLLPTLMLLRPTLALIRTLPVAELLMLILPSTTNKYYIVPD